MHSSVQALKCCRQNFVLAVDARMHLCMLICEPVLLHQHTAAYIRNRALHHSHMCAGPVLTAWPALSLTLIIACVPMMGTQHCVHQL